jgi:hypothetical protein
VSGVTAATPISCTPGHASQLRESATVERVARTELTIAIARQLQAHRHHVLRAESRIDREQAGEAAQDQPRTDEQHDRKRDLGDDERGRRPPRLCAHARPRDAFRTPTAFSERNRERRDESRTRASSAR